MTYIFIFKRGFKKAQTDGKIAAGFFSLRINISNCVGRRREKIIVMPD